jgi:hypothetical protein
MLGYTLRILFCIYINKLLVLEVLEIFVFIEKKVCLPVARASDARRLCPFHFGANLQVDLRHRDEVKDSSVVDIGIDLSEFYQSVEWDILEVPAERFVRL